MYIYCSAFHGYLRCVTTVAETECGESASMFIEDYSYRTAGPLIKVSFININRNICLVINYIVFEQFILFTKIDVETF